MPVAPRHRLHRCLWLPLIVAIACRDDDGSEESSDSALTDDTTANDSTVNTSSDSTSAEDTSGTMTSGTTSSPSSTDGTTGTESTDSGDTTSSSGTESTGSGSDTESTSAGSDSSSGSESSSGSDSGGSGLCGDDILDADIVCFASATSFNLAATSAPLDVELGDFNGDTHLDVATLNANGQLTVMLGDGLGALGAGSSEPGSDVCSGATPVRLVVGDFDGAGSDDLAVLCNAGTDAAGSVAILTSNAGDLTLADTVAVGNDASGLGAGDLSGDGHHDLIVANRADTQYTLIFPSDAMRSPETVASNSVTAPAAVALVDMGGPSTVTDAFYAGEDVYARSAGNQDPDTGTVTINPGQTLPGQVAGITNLRRANTHNFDNDAGNLIDIVVLSDTGSVVFFNSGGAGAVLVPVVLTAGTTPSEADAADLTGEGRGDVAIANEGDDTVSLFIGGGGTTLTPADPATLAVGDGPSGVALGDLNEDGVTDIVTCNRNADSVSVLLSDP